jgi:hypothetical protein
MKRVLGWTLMILGLLALGVVSSVLMLAERPEDAPPDPAMLIHLPDGSSRPLGELLDLAVRGEPLPAGRPLVRIQVPEQELAALQPAERAERERVLEDIRRMLETEIHGEPGSLYHLAEVARREGRLDEAAALYLSVPEDDRRYARARRRLAWDVMTKGQNQPRRAVAYAHEAAMLDPFNGNSWQDLARVYGATLGIDLD